MANTKDNAWSAAELEWLKRLRADGVAIARCGEILGRTENAVKAKIDRHNIAGKAAAKWGDDEDAALTAGLEEGMTFQDIFDAKLIPGRSVAGMKARAFKILGDTTYKTESNANKFDRQLSEEEFEAMAAKGSRRLLAALRRFFKKHYPNCDVAREAEKLAA